MHHLGLSLLALGVAIAATALLVIVILRPPPSKHGWSRQYYGFGGLAWTLFKRRQRQPRLTDQRPKPPIGQ